MTKLLFLEAAAKEFGKSLRHFRRLLVEFNIPISEFPATHGRKFALTRENYNLLVKSYNRKYGNA